MSGLNAFLGERALGVGECLESATVEAFLRDDACLGRARGVRSRRVGRVRCSVGRFQEYLRVLGYEQRACPPEPPEPLVEEYLVWMAQVRQTAPSTLVLRRRGVRRFLRGLGPQAPSEGLGQLRRESIEQFFLDDAEGKGESVRRCMRSSLSTFLQFALDRGLIDQPLHHAIPSFPCYSLARTPEGLTPEQAQSVLESVDRATPVGRRDDSRFPSPQTGRARLAPGGDLMRPITFQSVLSDSLERFVRLRPSKCKRSCKRHES